MVSMIVWTGELKPNTKDAYNAYVEKTVTPLLRQAQGLNKSITALDYNTNKIVWVMVWESEEADTAFTKTYEKEIRQAFAEAEQFYAVLPTQEQYDIIAMI